MKTETRMVTAPGSNRLKYNILATNSFPGMILRVVSVGNLPGRVLMQALDVVDELHVRLDVLAAGFDAGVLRAGGFGDALEPLPDTCVNLRGQLLRQGGGGSRFNCMIGGANGWSALTFTRLQRGAARVEPGS